MTDKWEWDTFVAINLQRQKFGSPPLIWCCAIESNTRGSCAGIVFHKFRVSRRVVEVVCPHWTKPEVIAGMLIGRDRHILGPKYTSGAVILNNDSSRTFAVLAYGKDKPISWEEMPTGMVCPFCHAGQFGDVRYLGHHPASYGTSEDTIEVEQYFCERCGKSRQYPH